jgi:molecular chaperone GrpE
MTGIDKPGDDGELGDPEVDADSGPLPVEGTEGAEENGLGPDYEAHGGAPEGSESDEVIDAEILDAADVSAAVDDVFADDDPLALALNQRDEYLDSLRRLQAEFENYKKRVVKQQADQVARAAVSLVDKVLPVLDTLDLATQHLGDAGSQDGRALVAVASQLHDVLAKEGLERIDPLGETFDPNAHEAVGHLPAADADDVGTGDGEDADAVPEGKDSGEPVVGQVMRAGYRWRGTVVRPAMVMVRG